MVLRKLTELSLRAVIVRQKEWLNSVNLSQGKRRTKKRTLRYNHPTRDLATPSRDSARVGREVGRKTESHVFISQKECVPPRRGVWRIFSLAEKGFLAGEHLCRGEEPNADGKAP